VTRSDGQWLVELDGRPAFEVWVEDVRSAGGQVPEGRARDVALFLANHYEIGVLDNSRSEELVRCPLDIRDDGAVLLAGSVGEGRRTRVMAAPRVDIFAASIRAATTASEAAGSAVSGALVLPCTSRMMTLGADFARENAAIARALRAPLGGACVYGEIARSQRDTDAFHNATTVILAFPA